MNMRMILIPCLALLLSACVVSQPRPGVKGSPQASGMKLSLLAKTDIDMVAEIHQQEVLSNLRLLAEKLYRRNPREWRKSGQPSLEGRVSQLFETPYDWHLPELEGKSGADSINLAF